jgi:hypothetical protein
MLDLELESALQEQEVGVSRLLSRLLSHRIDAAPHPSGDAVLRARARPIAAGFAATQHALARLALLLEAATLEVEAEEGGDVDAGALDSLRLHRQQLWELQAQYVRVRGEGGRRRSGAGADTGVMAWHACMTAVSAYAALIPNMPSPPQSNPFPLAVAPALLPRVPSAGSPRGAHR